MSNLTTRPTLSSGASTPPPHLEEAATVAEESPMHRDHEAASPSAPGRGHIGLVVFGSIAFGLVAALVLALLVFGGAQEPTVTGVILLAFAAGWAMLAVLSVRLTDQPQRWAVIPAGFVGVSGLGFLVFQPAMAAQ